MTRLKRTKERRPGILLISERAFCPLGQCWANATALVLGGRRHFRTVGLARSSLAAFYLTFSLFHIGFLTLCTCALLKKHRMLLITKEMILWQWSTEIAVKVGIHLPGVLPKLPAAGTYFPEPGVFRQCIVSWGGPHSQQLGQKDQGLSWFPQ